MRIEHDDVTRPQVLALLEEHLRNMYELSPPDQVFAFDASRLRLPEISVWTAWKDGTLLGCAALKELSATEGEVKSMRTRQRPFVDVGREERCSVTSFESPLTRISRVVPRNRSSPGVRASADAVSQRGSENAGPSAPYKENGNSVFMSLRLAKLITPDWLGVAIRVAGGCSALMLFPGLGGIQGIHSPHDEISGLHGRCSYSVCRPVGHCRSPERLLSLGTPSRVRPGCLWSPSPESPSASC